MLYKPTNARIARNSHLGCIPTGSAAQPVLRSASIQRQRLTKAQVGWRAAFSTWKQAWRSLAPGGVNYVLSKGVSPQQAWTLLNGYYAGILTTGLFDNNVQLQAYLSACSSGEAYHEMCQLNRQSLELPDLPPPPLVDAYLSYPDGTSSRTLGQFTVSVVGATTPTDTDPSIDLTLGWSASPLPDAPTALSATGSTLTSEILGPSRETVLDYAFENSPATATATSSTITFTITGAEIFADLTGYLLTSAGWTPSGYNVTAATVLSNTTTTVTIAAPSNPGSVTTAGVVTIYRVIEDLWFATATVSPSEATSTGTIPLTIGFTDGDGPHTFTVNLAATTGSVRPASTPPSFAFPTGMSCATVYDLDYNVTGFQLSYSWAGTSEYPTYRGLQSVPGVWQVTASDAYSSGGSAPSASKWSPILYAGPDLPGPTDVLDAWQAVWGELPDKGSIKFQLKYIDPVTGSSGPALSSTATWEFGTLTGFSRSQWAGPVFGWHLIPDLQTITAPGTVTCQAAVYGINGYSGTIKFEIQPGSSVPNGYNATAKSFPDGFTASVSPETVTIAAGDLTPHYVTVTLSAVSGAFAYSGTLKIAASDGVTTSKPKVPYVVNGTTTLPPPVNYLGVDPGSVELHLSSPGTVSQVFTCANSGPDDLDIALSATPSDNRITATLDTNAITLLAASGSSPTTATVTLTLTAETAFDTYGIWTQLKLSCGKNTTYAAISLGA